MSVLAIEEPAPGAMVPTLDRPARRNALDLALIEAVAEALAEAELIETDALARRKAVGPMAWASGR